MHSTFASLVTAPSSSSSRQLSTMTTVAAAYPGEGSRALIVCYSPRLFVFLQPASSILQHSLSRLQQRQPFHALRLASHAHFTQIPALTMLYYTFPIYALLAAGMAALPQHFISQGSMASSPLQPHLGGAVLSSATSTTQLSLQSTLTSTISLTTTQVNVPPTTTQAATTPPCLHARTPTTFTTLPNPTPSPTLASTSLDPREATRNNDSTDDDNGDDAADPLNPTPWPKWLGAATFALAFYDVLTLCAFFWLWITGHFWWLRWNGQTDFEEDRERLWEMARGGGSARGRARAIDSEMLRMGMV